MNEEVTEEVKEEVKSDSLLDVDPAVEVVEGEMPEGLDPKYWDDEGKSFNTQAMLDDLSAKENRIKGLRQKLTNGEHKAPKDIAEYVFERPEGFPEDLVPDDDPLVQTAREQAKELGIPKELFSQFVGGIVAKVPELMEQLTSVEPSEEELAANKEAELSKLGPNGKEIARMTTSWINEFQAKGVMGDADLQALHSSIQTAEQVAAFNKLRMYMGDKRTIPMNDVNGTGKSRIELERELSDALHADDEAKYNSVSAQLAKLN